MVVLVTAGLVVVCVLTNDGDVKVGTSIVVTGSGAGAWVGAGWVKIDGTLTTGTSDVVVVVVVGEVTVGSGLMVPAVVDEVAVGVVVVVVGVR